MRKPSLRVLFLVFIASGFSGLIYESIWTHYLKLFLGHAAYAQTLVLAIFMGGMALGSWACGRWAGRWANLLRGYALAEGAIGLMALAFHTVFDRSVGLAYASVIPALGSVEAVMTFKWGLASLLILPQSILLGMTFPLMAGAVIRRDPDQPGSTLATLYFCNSLGGALGVLTSGFLLIRLVGLPGTGATAGVINVVLAVVAWSLAGAQPEPPLPTPSVSKPDTGNRERYALLLLVALLTGTASFIYEVGWIRLLSLVLGSSTHAFELMVSAFILGLAFGGLWIRRRIDAIEEPLRFLGVVQVLMGLLALSTLYLYNSTFGVMHWLVTTIPKSGTGYLQFNLASHAIAGAIMLPATFCAGTTLPLITYSLLRSGRGEGSIGAVYGANTVGAIAGVFFAIHFGMPVLGLRALISWGAALDIGLGLLLLWRLRDTTGARLPAIASLAGLGAIAVTLLGVDLDAYQMASGVFRQSQRVLSASNADVIFQKDGKTATVHLVDEHGFVSIRTNGKIDALINLGPVDRMSVDESTMVLAGALPLLLHPAARTAANIGMGSGLTTHVLLSAPGLEAVDTIEIEAAMVEASAGFLRRNERAFRDPRSRIHIDDAKTFLSAHGRLYDVIVSEPSNPWVSGVAGLFSVEFYRLASRHLNPGGMLVQWLQLYEFNLDLVASVLKALQLTFADYAIYASATGDILIVATRERPVPELDAAAFASTALVNELERIRIEGVEDLAIRKVADRRLLGPWIDSFDIRPNSDYYPILDQRAARARFMNQTAQGLLSLGLGPIPTLETLAGVPRPSARSRRRPPATMPAAYSAHRAALFHDSVRSVEPTPGSFDPKAREEARRILLDCARPPAVADHRSFLFSVALNVVPYLHPAELSTVWTHLERLPCLSTLSPRERDWIELLKAVGGRDGRGMAERAEKLLHSEDEPTERRHYLLAVAMLGRVAVGDPGAARSLWAENGPEVRRGPLSLLMEVLAAHDRTARRPAP